MTRAPLRRRMMRVLIAAQVLGGLGQSGATAGALELAASDDETGRPPKLPLRSLLAPPAAVTGLATIVVANFVMVAVMAMAPVHMDHQGHGLRLVGLVISLHIAGMFAPAPLTGWLTDRLGPLPVAAAGAAALVVSAGRDRPGRAPVRRRPRAARHGLERVPDRRQRHASLPR